MEKMILYCGDDASEVLIKNIAQEHKLEYEHELKLERQVEEDGEPVDEGTDKEARPIGIILFSGYLTKKAAENAAKLADKYHMVLYDYGDIVEVLSCDDERRAILPFDKESLSLLAYQIVIASTLCKKLAIPSLFVPTYNNDGKPIPDSAVIMKYMRKAVRSSTAKTVSIITPLAMLTGKQLAKLAKKYV